MTILRDGRVIDPAAGFDGIADVLITGDGIAAVGPVLLAKQNTSVIADRAVGTAVCAATTWSAGAEARSGRDASIDGDA
ncbi:hypothetical protein P3102_10630 [Amycolatopsis sp. QT-25]|uniref:hypothetical protein n=1 Tax=Amycolatopsis sp. QT-25 TaxID=3034022 RepID=UPI0023EC1B47|nr:hypothetical protein [Amycolatopsis sp. QT-25]WET81628.1 hypothetical protein P3102_10630 [Amycolatopsis sp. QT-25]